jgi:leucyl-tRNA synthetase
MSEDRAVAPAGDQAGAEFPFRYDAALASKIELAWQERWQAEGTFYAPNPAGDLAAGFDAVAGRQKAYILDFFPYPSGAGLHVGHPLGYIATDVLCRFLRMTGHNVLHAFGYDAFGLPAEQYAIGTGQHPAVTTRDNIARMRWQLLRLGLGYDTRRELATTDPRFYRWTQWIFLQIFNSWFDEDQQRARPVADLVAEFEAGTRAPSGPANPGGQPWAELDELTRREVVNGWRLAYLSEEMVNWSPDLGTVLANEEVTAEGRSDVGNFPVYRRPLRQWLLRITAYAERLLADLDGLDWPEPVKQQQRNWIGRSDGATIVFPVTAGPRERLPPGVRDLRIEAFTTRPDTLPGATYLVLAPEHPLAGALAADRWPEGTPPAWQSTGDAVSATTGPGTTVSGTTGPADAVAAYQRHASTVTDRQRAADRDKTGVFTGSYVTNPVTGQPIPVFLADYVLMGYGTGAIMAVPAHDERDLEFAQRFGLPVTTAVSGGGEYTGWQAAGLDLVPPTTTGEAIEAAIGWLERTGHGRRQRTYRLRDWLFSRQRYWGEPFPVVYDADGLPVGLPEDMLPVTLPEMTEFAAAPAQGGGDRGEPGAPGAQDWGDEPVPPLARAGDWATVELDLGHGRQVYRRELNTMPQWAGSCWYYLRYLDPHNEDVFVGRQAERYWMVPAGAAPGDGGVDLYVGGVEHAVLHLLYARFWHKVLLDLGHVSTREPFWRLVNQGYITADAFTDARGMYVAADQVQRRADGSFVLGGQQVTRRVGKMGKSLKNSISPDDMYARYGADTLRLYEMAMGPIGVDRPWQTEDITGVYRFLQRLWRSMVDERTGDLAVDDGPLDQATERLLHSTIAQVREHYAGLRFNIAIARLQELASHAARIAAGRGRLPRALAEPLALMVAPLAPHVGEELWARLGHRESLACAPFPQADPALAAEPTVVLPVQVNGRTRLRIEVPADASREQIAEIVDDHPEVARHVGGAEVDRVVVVPGRIVNIVTRH